MSYIFNCVALGCDHGGYDLKKEIIKYLNSKNIKFIDFGSHNIESVDYPEYANNVCDAVKNGKSDCGILLCGTGIGMSIAANKHKGIRASCCSDTFSARMTRMHNDANILCMGGRVIGSGLALDITELFLTTKFEKGRHEIRVKQIADFENKHEN